jgi:hypothetical protein
MSKIKWMAWEKYTGKILATSDSYEALMRRGAAIRAACIGKSDHLPEWAGRNWRKGDVLPLRDAKGNPA